MIQIGARPLRFEASSTHACKLFWFIPTTDVLKSVHYLFIFVIDSFKREEQLLPTTVLVFINFDQNFGLRITQNNLRAVKLFVIIE